MVAFMSRLFQEWSIQHRSAEGMGFRVISIAARRQAHFVVLLTAPAVARLLKCSGSSQRYVSGILSVLAQGAYV